MNLPRQNRTLKAPERKRPRSKDRGQNAETGGFEPPVELCPTLH